MGRLSIENIAEAAEIIDSVFLDTPQFVSEPLSSLFGTAVMLKVETLNPIGSFKGRGTDYLLHRIEVPRLGLVCASAGNFGQGIAYAGRKHGHPVTVFTAVGANPLKVERMRMLGARVEHQGADFDAAKDFAREHAAQTGALFVEDGSLPPIAEGAGTIGLELCRTEDPIDVVLVPLGDGALVGGIGTWMRRASPSTRIVGVVAAGAPAMERSWRAGRAIATDTVSTIADGIAVRVPIAEAVDDVKEVVDDVVLVSEEQIVDAMRLLFIHAALVAEPAGAAGLAAAGGMREALKGRRVAVIVTGGNASEEQRRLLFEA